MDSLEASSIVYSKIRKIEPHNVAKKIIGVLLLEDRGQEMIRLAYGPDHYIHTLVEEIKIRHGLISPPLWNPQMAHGRMNTPDFVPPPIHVHQNQNQEFFNFDGVSREYFLNHYFNSREPLGERQVKVCQYFIKGYCRNGNNCRFFHGPPPDHEVVGGMFLPGSIRRLESDIYKLLKSRGGGPVSIASLPSLYQDKYGRNLQAEGYLTESQRHGKAGYNLTKLLARLKCIRIIDRPHGQHAVTLAENGFNIRERNDPGPIVTGSRQIYLTFPAESTFTEEDVSDYFSHYGPVQEVRIPWQEKRMFGFVNFSSAETVQLILKLDNPHFVCGARVLVKAYREKPNAIDRNYHENTGLASYIDSDLYPSNWRAAGMLNRQMEQEKTFEIVKHLDRLCIGQIPLGQPNFGYATIDDKNPIVDEAGHPELSERQFNYLVNDLSNGTTNQDHPNLHGINYIGHDSQRIGLPDSPF